MDKHDADRVNGAFSDFARKQERDRAKIIALEKAIQSQGQQIILLQQQIGLITRQAYSNGNFNRLGDEGNTRTSE